MDAWRDGDTFVIEFDLPAIDPEQVELDVERNVLTVRAERLSPTGPNVELIASERPGGCSAARSSSATRWIPTTSGPATTLVCSA